MTVVKIKVLPIKNVNENLEIFRTQAIGTKMQHRAAPIISAGTVTPKNVSIILLTAVVMKDINESENENYVPNIMKSSSFLALPPRILAVIKEYDLIPVFFAHSTSLRALIH